MNIYDEASKISKLMEELERSSNLNYFKNPEGGDSALMQQAALYLNYFLRISPAYRGLTPRDYYDVVRDKWFGWTIHVGSDDSDVNYGHWFFKSSAEKVKKYLSIAFFDVKDLAWNERINRETNFLEKK